MKKLLPNTPLSNIKIVDTDKKYSLPENLQQKSDKIWSELLVKSKARGTKVWNGVIYRLEKIQNKNDKTVLHLGEIEFKDHYSTSELTEKISKMPFNQRPNGIYTLALIKTKDNKYILGRRSIKTLWKSQLAPIGGGLSKDELKVKNSTDLKKSIFKEIEEELNITKKDIIKTRFLGIYVSPTQRIAVAFKIFLNKSSSELRKIIKLNFEHESITFLNKKEVSKNYKNLTNALQYFFKDNVIN